MKNIGRSDNLTVSYNIWNNEKKFMKNRWGSDSLFRTLKFLQFTNYKANES